MRRARSRPVWLITLLAACSGPTRTTRPDWDTAQVAAQLRCQAGDLASCGELGRSLLRDARDERDLERGLVLLEGACCQQDMASCAALGQWYAEHDTAPN